MRRDASKAFTLRGGVLGLACLGGMVLHLLLSGRWWVWNVASVVPPVALVVLPLAVVAWSVLNRRWIGVGAASVALSLALPLADVHVPRLVAAPDETGARLTVFNWNTEHWADGADRSALYAFLQERDADVYHLQEHLDAATRAPIPDDAELAREFPEYAALRNGELLTLTRLPVVATWAPPDRTVLRVDVALGEEVIHLYNVHIPVHVTPRGLADPVAFIGDVERRFDARAEELAGLVADVRADRSPLVVSGDFNSTASMGVMGPLLAETEDVAVAAGATWPRTWPSWGLRLWRIDYVLARGLVTRSHHPVDPQGLSDHWGQHATLALQPAPAVR